MNTFARQSISKTLIKACTAAVLLVTCFNAHADSSVQNLSESFRAETMQSINAEQKTKDVIESSQDILDSALEKVSLTEAYRSETFATMQVENADVSMNSLNILNAALESFEYSNSQTNTENEFVASNTVSTLESIWVNNIQPQFTTLDTLKFDASDVAGQEAAVIAIDFAIEALETARINFLESNYSL